MTALLLLFLILAIAAAIGRRVLVLTGAIPPTRAERWVYSIGLGLGAIAYLVLAIGLLGYLRTLPVVIACCILAALCWRGFAVSLRDLPPARLPGRPSPWAIVTGCILIALTIIAAIDAFVPPAAHEWDALSYHLAAPKVYLQHQRIVFLPTDHHSNFPFLIQMLFTLGLMLNGYALADLLHLTTAALTVILLLVVGARRSGPVAGRIAALAFATSPIVVWEAGAAYIDLGFTFYTFLAVAALLDYRDARQPAWAALAGIAMGLALGVKAIALAPCFLAGLLLAAERTPLKHLMRYALAALIVGCPFYVKSWVQTGNPVYPFAYRVFGGVYWNQQLADQYSGSQARFGLGEAAPSVIDDARCVSPTYGRLDASTRVRNLFLAPFGLISLPRIFYDANDPGVFSHLGFLFLALPVLALLAPTAGPGIRWAAWLALLWYIVWAQSMQYVRYLLPVLPLLALVGADAVCRMGRLVLALAGLALTVQTVLTLGYFGYRLPSADADHPGQWARATDAEAREQYLSRQLNAYAAEQWLNRNTPPNAGVVLYEEVRGFYLDRPYLWGNRGHSLYIPYDRMHSGRDLANWFLDHGYSYALVNLQYSQHPEVAAALRQAVEEGSTLALFLRWYNPQHPDAEIWPMLLGDAVLSGAARFVPQASVRGCVVLEFVRTPRTPEGWMHRGA